MPSTTYDYQKPQNTIDIDHFINCKSDVTMCYYNTSYRDRVDNIIYSTYNVVSDYIDELRDGGYCVYITLNDEQFLKYKYRPKLLCFDIYKNTELYFIILMINDMYNVKQFNKKRLLLPTPEGMTLLTKRIINANKKSLDRYAKRNT